jgi:microcystin-dependent protein
MSEPYLGQICMFGFSFAPYGWAFCNGQTTSIAQNSALFALLGTIYGGDGVQTFGLPDFQGRIPIHQGQGPNLTDRIIGEKLGNESSNLILTNLPPHYHDIAPKAVDAAGTSLSPTNAVFAISADNRATFETNQSVTVNMASIPSDSVGGNLPHTNVQPFLAVNFCICLEGIFPSRN